jgi:hypothetical protein
LPFGDQDLTIKFLQKEYHGFKQITIDFNRSEVFEALICEFNTGNKSDKLLFNEEKLSQIARLRELWSNNFTLDHLSTRWVPRDWIGSISKNQMMPPKII